jgi:uncharacterized iron-regulated membrane protein
MGFWMRPKPTFLRRALFQIHLWTGIAVGLYMVFISLTGSAVVFRRDLNTRMLGNILATDVAADAQKLPEADLRAAIQKQYPGYRITRLAMARRRLSPSEATLTKDGETLRERFNGFTGADMGNAFPKSVAVMEWFTDLHDNLLKGETGRKVNAVGGALLCLLCLSGLVIWWKASGAWYKGFFFNPRSSWKRINFDLHAALGFWGLLILVLWGISGIYFGFPDFFIKAVDYFEPPAQVPMGRRGDAFIAWMVRMHFGRYGGMGVRITYVIIGLLPAVMFVTGAIMWWNRVVRRWLAETHRLASPARGTPAPALARGKRAPASLPAHAAAEQVD